MPTNARLEPLADNPFSRLKALLSPIAPAANEPPILMSLGDPQHEPPTLVARQPGAAADPGRRDRPVG